MDWLNDHVELAAALRIAVILAGALVLNRVLRRIIRRFADRIAEGRQRSAHKRIEERQAGSNVPTAELQLRAAGRATTIGVVLRSMSSVVVYGVAALLVLGELGINLGPLIAGAGIAGIAIGFGAQSLVRDFLAGIFILVEDQYGVGDIVDLGEAVGTVEAVTLRATRLRDTHGTVWHVPNGQVLRVGNKSQQWARAVIDVTVSYSTDLRKAERVIKRVADEVWHDEAIGARVLDEPEVLGVEQVTLDGAQIRLQVRTLPAEQFSVMRELRLRLKEAFQAEGIETPYNRPSMVLAPQSELAAARERAAKKAAPTKRAT